MAPKCGFFLICAFALPMLIPLTEVDGSVLSGVQQNVQEQEAQHYCGAKDAVGECSKESKSTQKVKKPLIPIKTRASKTSNQDRLERLPAWDAAPSTPRLKYVSEIPSRVHKNPFHYNGFNVTASDLTPTDRKVPDVKIQGCKKKFNISELPRATVIICFHNEARSTLYRTVRSVLDRSPRELIDEIILIDDFSDDREQGAIVLGMEKVRILRNSERMGLIRSRVRGVNAAQSDVVVFLDSHCECTNRWLEPLLERIKEDNKRLVSPVIDPIDSSNFDFSLIHTISSRGGFAWSLMFLWEPLSKRQDRLSDPILTPVIAGGLFAVDRKFFNHLGQYDLSMNIWGAENIEISLRWWMCGGSLEIIPCSHVGHVFRLKHPYSFPEGMLATLDRNTARVAEVWLDDYKYHYYFARKTARNASIGNLDDRIMLRSKLQCHDFSWYLKNVYPDKGVVGTNLYETGNVRIGNLCVDTFNKIFNHTIVLEKCQGVETENQEWHLSVNHLLHNVKGQGMHLCLGATDNRIVLIMGCPADPNNIDPNLQWDYSEDDGHLRHIGTNMCLDGKIRAPLMLAECEENNPKQKWSFDYF